MPKAKPEIEPKISAVIFDIGNVFVRWDPRNLYSQHFEDKEEMEYFLNTVTTAEWNLAQDAGRSFADATALLTAKFPHYGDMIALYDSHWVETLGGEISGVKEILLSLKRQGFPLYAITNFSAEKWPVFCEKYAFTKEFQDTIVSGEVGLTKPGREIYELAIKRFDLVPKRSIFIDDSLPNVRGAEAAGMRGFHFTGVEALVAKLKALNLLF